MRRRLGLGLVVAGLALAVVVVALVLTGSGPPPRLSGDAGGAAPAFVLADLRHPGATLALAGFRGRPLVLNFWASWCGPCRSEMPAIEAVYARMDGRVAIVGIDHEDGPVPARRFLTTTGARYSIASDPGGGTARAYRVRGLPSTVFIRATGRILLRHTGPVTRASLQATVDRLFAQA